ncbi:MAG: DUF459 domain-containing protein, partial [Verrucomicrobia bacterium]|nr:DUF459 domain-containing protein [Verrucomicrobiota bacterium]
MKSSRLWIALMSLLLAVFGPAGAAEGPPRRVLILGDSMMQIPAHALELELSKRLEVKTRAFTRIGTGLARLDVFDWMERIRSLVEEFTPDTAL